MRGRALDPYLLPIRPRSGCRWPPAAPGARTPNESPQCYFPTPGRVAATATPDRARSTDLRCLREDERLPEGRMPVHPADADRIRDHYGSVALSRLRVVVQPVLGQIDDDP